MISMALIATALSIWLLERAGLFKEMRARDATRGHGFVVVPVSARVEVGDFWAYRWLDHGFVHAAASNPLKHTKTI